MVEWLGASDARNRRPEFRPWVLHKRTDSQVIVWLLCKHTKQIQYNLGENFMI